MWAWVGVWFGLAMLAKYHAILVMLGLFVLAITSREHRRWFFEPGPYLALVIALVIFSPVIDLELAEQRCFLRLPGRPDSRERRLPGRVADPQPDRTDGVGWAMDLGADDRKLWSRALARTAGRQGLVPVLWSGAADRPVHGGGAVGAALGWHFHWQAPGYILLFPLLGVMALDRLERNHRVTHVWLFASLVSLLVIFTLLVAQVATGWMRFLVPGSMPRRN